MAVLDSSIFVAALHSEDTLHERGKTVLAEIEKPIEVPEYVAVETATVLTRVAGKAAANAFVRSLFDNRDILILLSSPEQFAATADRFLSSNGKLSFVDCTLLALSPTHTIITFDKTLARAIESQKK